MENILLEYYKTMWSNPEIAGAYWKCSENAYGRILWFMNTNFRTIAPAFTNAYQEMLAEEGKAPYEFQLVDTHLQSKVKQLTVRLRQAWLYYIDTEGKYRQTKRGIAFNEIMSDTRYTAEEKDVLCYIFLLAAEFNNTSKYLIRRTNEIFQFYKDAGYTDLEILLLQKDFIRTSNEDEISLCNLANLDYFYIANLYRPFRLTDFLSQYRRATNDEKQVLKNYVIKNIENHSSNCILSKKFETSGNFNKPMLVECAWILYITRSLILSGRVSYDQFIDKILSSYAEFYTIRREKIKDLISEYNNVFETIYNIVYDVEAVQSENTLSQDDLTHMGVVDPTDTEGQIQQQQVSEALKQLAKESSNYRCILENIEGCEDHYFTSKKENQNYLEVHHFIPREYSSEFDSSIEILANYVALCPCCHRKIHHATDRERKGMITSIYNQRKEMLAQKGIVLQQKKIYDFYKFDKE